MTTVAQIAAKAFIAVAAKITDAIHPATLTRETQGAYNPTTGAYAVTTVVQTGRAAVDTVRPVTDVFPSYVVGPGDQLVLLEGFTIVKENDALVITGKPAMVVRAVQDIVAAGTLFYIIAR